MEPTQAAINEIESLNPGESFTYAEIARRHSVDRNTLSRNHRKVQSSRTTKRINQQKLNLQQEQELIQYIKTLTERHTPPTREMIQNFASTIAKEAVSESWVTRFINRHSIHLISQWTTGMDSNRHKADSEEKYRLYFSLLHCKIDQYHIEPRHTYNIDEKGFLIGILSRSKRVFSRRMWEKKEVRASLQDGNRAWITLLACICADGSALPPSLIYDAANKGIQSSWVEEIRAGDHGVFITSSPSGWTNNDIGLAWLEQVFDRCTKAKARRSYRLLVLDGHGSHVTMDFIDYCDQNRILLMILPPHSTHTLQPLDVGMFKPLSTAYSAELSGYLHRSQGLASITKGDFFPLFWKAWEASFRESTILSSFRATGISPPDPDPILDRFTQGEESGNSSSSGLSDHDWRKMDRLIQLAVKDQGSQDTKKLRQSLHHLSVQNELLKHEMDGIKVLRFAFN
jgi:hypothetical protein